MQKYARVSTLLVALPLWFGTSWESVLMLRAHAALPGLLVWQEGMSLMTAPGLVLSAIQSDAHDNAF